MSRSANFVWPEPSDNAIALSQVLVAAGNLVLNGTLKDPNNPVVILPGINRQITITSSGNVSAVNFRITGTYLGQPITEQIPGPNANTVETSGLFNTIISVTADDDTGLESVSIGTGSSGHTNVYVVDPHSSVCALSAHVIVTSGLGDITYSFYSSLQDLDDNFSINNGKRTMYNMRGSAEGVEIGAHGMLAIDAAGNTPPDYELPVYGQVPVKLCWITVTGDIANPASLRAYILQQGIT